MERFTMAFAAPKQTLFTILGFAASAAAIHCSSNRDAFDAPKDDASVVGSFTDAATGSVDAPEPLPDCADENKLIYVLSRKDKELHRFDPATLTFTSIGKIACATTSDTFSMAVDRRGTAWVEYTDGRIFSVSTKDASCTATPYRPGQSGFRNFGMGFAKDDNAAGAPLSETLYIAGDALGRLDLSTFEISLVGQGTSGIGELTGTGSGTLYAFLQTGNRLVRLDKATGSILETYRPDVEIGSSWAFAQWGGDFWLFTSPVNARTTVTRYSPSTNTSTVMIEDAGMLIVGAGSSTCAPSVPPR